ncbi:MAG: undecaprenyl-diphosphatase UppP [Planctomycetia bacterium]|nr:undecaprenyl-diphosphatase UppP [Planctomycetia bacterium]
MTLLEAVVLGVVQGLTEFLPISSTAHLRLVPAALGWEDPGAAFSAVLQCGTLVAVLIAMRRDVVALTRGFLRGVASGHPWGTVESRVAIMIVLGTLPIVAVGLAAREFIRGDARGLDVIATAVLGGTILMAAAELVCRARARRGEAGRDGLEAVRLADAVAMGLTQVLALIPGASRSGTTISSGMLTGLDRRTAARFSFLLSLPAVGAAGLLEAWQARHEILATGDDILAAVVGTVVAGVAGYASIRWLLRRLTSHTLWPFILYRLALAGVLAWACVPQPVRVGGQPPMIPESRFSSEQVPPCSATSTTGAAWPGSSRAS